MCALPNQGGIKMDKTTKKLLAGCAVSILIIISIVVGLKQVSDQTPEPEPDPRPTEFTGTYIIRPIEYKISFSTRDNIEPWMLYEGHYINPGWAYSGHPYEGGLYKISFTMGGDIIANITLNLTSDGNQIHITKDQGVWVHPDGTEEIFYNVPVFNGTITDKWTIILDGQQNHRFEINNNTIVQTDEYWYHNMDIGNPWEYKEYKIVYVGGI